MRIARETWRSLLPWQPPGYLAHEVGMEDLGLRYSDPEKYHEIAALIAERRESREKYIQRVVAELQTRLRLEGIALRWKGAEAIYSIYRKMMRKGIELRRSSMCVGCA